MHSVGTTTRTYLPMKMEQSVPKLRHINFRRRGITQKKAYNIQYKAKVWNKDYNVEILNVKPVGAVRTVTTRLQARERAT